MTANDVREWLGGGAMAPRPSGLSLDFVSRAELAFRAPKTVIFPEDTMTTTQRTEATRGRRPMLLAAVLALLTATPAWAGQSPFRIRTSRPAYPGMEVARPITLQKEWAEYGLTYQFRDVSEVTDADGNVDDADYEYRLSWLTLDARYGFTRNLTLFMSLPFSVASERVGGDDGEGTITESGLGDVRFGFTWQAFHREGASTLTSLGVTWDTKQPSGQEAPGAPGSRHLTLGTGTTNTGLTLHAKQRVGPVAAVARAGYVHKFSAVTMWVRDLETGYNGRFKPGDELSTGLHLTIQPIRFAALTAGADYVRRMESAVGASSNDISPANDLETIEDSDFEALSASGRVIVQAGENWDLAGGVSIPLMSRNSGLFFPLEDLTQSYGTTFTGSLLFRW